VKRLQRQQLSVGGPRHRGPGRKRRHHGRARFNFHTTTHQSQNVRRRHRLLQLLIPKIATCSNGDRRPSSVNARQYRRHPHSESPLPPTRARRATARGQTKSTTRMPASRPVAGVRTLVPHPERIGGILLLLDAGSNNEYDHDDLDLDTTMSLPLLCRPPLALLSPYIPHIFVMRCSNSMHRLSGLVCQPRGPCALTAGMSAQVAVPVEHMLSTTNHYLAQYDYDSDEQGPLRPRDCLHSGTDISASKTNATASNQPKRSCPALPPASRNHGEHR
jgi:hypothetical protein